MPRNQESPLFLLSPEEVVFSNGTLNDGEDVFDSYLSGK